MSIKWLKEQAGFSTTTGENKISLNIRVAPNFIMVTALRVFVISTLEL